MQLDTGSDLLPPAAAEAGLALRWVCVLQKGGVEDMSSLGAASTGPLALACGSFALKSSMCRRQPHRATTLTRATFGHEKCRYRLAWLLIGASRITFQRYQSCRGAYRCTLAIGKAQTFSIAAYTEPSVVWERTNAARLARSWNLMASGECLASLEDASSGVCGSSLNAVSSTLSVFQ